jgi:hypothetical protein
MKPLAFTLVLLPLLLLLSTNTHAQKIDSICFNLYTDSLKKGVHNYINVDGKLSNGRYIPLDNNQLSFTSNYGVWQGNNLIIDSSYNKDSVVVTVALKTDAALTKSVTIYLKRNLTPEHLPTEAEVLQSRPARKKKG